MPNPRSKAREPLAQAALDRTKFWSLLVQGVTNKEIGEHLAISERGVKYHVSRLLRFYGVETCGELIALLFGRRRGRDP